MLTDEELQAGCADLLIKLRKETGSTREEMAAALGVDRKTYARYESGTSSPTAPALIGVFAALHQDALRSVLDMMYPDIYEGLDQNSSADDLRAGLVHYIQNIAADHEVRALSYLIHGGHGSNWRPQLEEFLMLDHLPLVNRIAIANLIDEFFSLSQNAHQLIGTDHVMPDVEVFRDGLRAGREAAYNGDGSYSTSSKKNKT